MMTIAFKPGDDVGSVCTVVNLLMRILPRHIPAMLQQLRLGFRFYFAFNLRNPNLTHAHHARDLLLRRLLPGRHHIRPDL